MRVLAVVSPYAEDWKLRFFGAERSDQLASILGRGAASAVAMIQITGAAAANPQVGTARAAFPGGPVFVTLPAAPNGFMMGSRDYKTEKDQSGGPHKVTINYQLEMGQSEVTVAQWRMCAVDGVCKHNPTANQDGNLPITSVSWFDAQEFANWMNIKTGLDKLPANDKRRYRLPTEAEWEYAARAGTTTTWSHGNDEAALKDFAWYYDNSESKARPVMTAKPNPWKLFDMHGNAEEWVQDCYKHNYVGVPVNGDAYGRLDDKTCDRSRRGGYWNGLATHARSANRFGLSPDNRGFAGLRLARTLPQEVRLSSP
jgi:formylglycine-generating enzyme required for sulfatase activity